jgi:hypothetical protein
MGKGTETESFLAVGKSHTEITDNTETVMVHGSRLMVKEE